MIPLGMLCGHVSAGQGNCPLWWRHNEMWPQQAAELGPAGLVGEQAAISMPH